MSAATPPFRAEDAIAYALEVGDDYVGAEFLRTWQEGRWDELREFWPDAYTKYAVHRSPEDINNGLPPQLQALVRAAIDLCQARGGDPYVERLRSAGRAWDMAAGEVGHGMV